MEGAVILIFDENEAEEYDQWYETKLGNFVDKVESTTAFELYQPKSKEKILDIGCGTGNFSIKLAEKGCEVTGIDVSEPMLEKARLKAKKNNFDINFSQQDVLDLKFPDNSFDGVFSITAIEFISDIKKAYKEMKRVVKPGGKILIGTITRDSDWGNLYQQKAKDENSVFHHAVLRNPEDFENIDSKNLEEIRECLFIPPNIPQDKINWDEEKRLSAKKKGGFFCVLWKITQ